MSNVLGRPRILPDASPRACAKCEGIFTPARKKWKQKYCSLACQRSSCLAQDNATLARMTAAKRGDKQRGRGEGKTYRKLNGKHEHRVVAERMLGRELKPGEVVHHKDGNKLNNLESNLEVLDGQSEHARLHAAERPKRFCCCGLIHYAKGFCKKHYTSRWLQAKKGGA